MAIALVTGQSNSASNSPATLAFPASVTAGDSVLIGVVSASDTAIPVPSITKSSGTATISALTQDGTYNQFGSPWYFRLDVYRATVTGSGSLTIGFSVTNAVLFNGIISEFSGIASAGTPSTNTGTSTSESTGAITASTGDMIFALFAEASGAAVNHVASDSVLYVENDGTTTLTGLAEYKLITSAGSYSVSATIASNLWYALGVRYLAAATGTTYTESVAEAASGNTTQSVGLQGSITVSEYVAANDVFSAVSKLLASASDTAVATETSGAIFLRITPQAGSYLSDQLITLLSDSGIQIVYTIDGTEPDITGWMIGDDGSILVFDNGQPVILDGV